MSLSNFVGRDVCTMVDGYVRGMLWSDINEEFKKCSQFHVVSSPGDIGFSLELVLDLGKEVLFIPIYITSGFTFADLMACERLRDDEDEEPVYDDMGFLITT